MKVNVVYAKSFFGLDEVEDDSVDLIFADPPYGISKDTLLSNPQIGYEPKKGNWDLVSKEYLKEFAEHLGADALRVLKPSGSIVVSGVFGSLRPYFANFVSLGFKFRHHIVWHKTNPAPSVHRRSFVYSNEILLWFSKTNKWYFDYDLSKTYNKGKQLHDVWDIPSVRKQAGVTRKPKELMERIVRILSPEGGLVLDPCVGSGTTIEVARKFRRKFVAYEIGNEQLKLLRKKKFNVVNHKIKVRLRPKMRKRGVKLKHFHFCD